MLHGLNNDLILDPWYEVYTAERAATSKQRPLEVLDERIYFIQTESALSEEGDKTRKAVLFHSFVPFLMLNSAFLLPVFGEDLHCILRLTDRREDSAMAVRVVL